MPYFQILSSWSCEMTSKIEIFIENWCSKEFHSVRVFPQFVFLFPALCAIRFCTGPGKSMRKNVNNMKFLVFISKKKEKKNRRQKAYMFGGECLFSFPLIHKQGRTSYEIKDPPLDCKKAPLGTKSRRVYGLFWPKRFFFNWIYFKLLPHEWKCSPIILGSGQADIF